MLFIIIQFIWSYQSLSLKFNQHSLSRQNTNQSHNVAVISHINHHCCYLFRSNHQRCSMKKCVLRIFTKFTRKYLSQNLFFNKLCLRPATLLNKRLWHRCFPVNFTKLLGTPFWQNISGPLLLFIYLALEKHRH